MKTTEELAREAGLSMLIDRSVIDRFRDLIRNETLEEAAATMHPTFGTFGDTVAAVIRALKKDLQSGR
jgi:hypothetical protein